MVDGVTKISALENTATSNSKAENFRKLILATSKDIRVLLVKIADRLHNMRTIKAINNEEKKKKNFSRNYGNIRSTSRQDGYA